MAEAVFKESVLVFFWGYSFEKGAKTDLQHFMSKLDRA